jgi:cellobiose-specific phosphotransferase system component IIA
MIAKRLAAVLTALVIGGAAVACDDNAEDHADEAVEEMQEGDYENAAESMEDAREDLEQGDTTELLN